MYIYARVDEYQSIKKSEKTRQEPQKSSWLDSCWIQNPTKNTNQAPNAAWHSSLFNPSLAESEQKESEEEEEK